MLVPLSWLREYVDIPLPTAKLAERLTLAGLEEASLTQTGELWEADKNSCWSGCGRSAASRRRPIGPGRRGPRDWPQARGAAVPESSNRRTQSVPV